MMPQLCLHCSVLCQLFNCAMFNRYCSVLGQPLKGASALFWLLCPWPSILSYLYLYCSVIGQALGSAQFLSLLFCSWSTTHQYPISASTDLSMVNHWTVPISFSTVLSFVNGSIPDLPLLFCPLSTAVSQIYLYCSVLCQRQYPRSTSTVLILIDHLRLPNLHLCCLFVVNHLIVHQPHS